MSGHSHWKSIKRTKQAQDERRGKIFSKLSRLISVAAREGGGDPASNPELRVAIEEARSFNLPKDNIQRAIDRGTGKIAGEKMEEIILEGFGPGGTAVIIEGITDNKNRTLSEIKQIFNQNGGKLAGEGSVKWMFEREGVVIVKNGEKEKLEMEAIEAGAEDIYWHEDLLDVFTKPEELEKVKKNLEEKGIKIESSSLDWVAKEMLAVNEKNKEACQKLFEALDENEAVQDIYSNLAT